MRYLFALACAATLTVGAAQASTPHNGLYGTVSRGPITPVCVAEQPCSGPAAGVTLQFWKRGRLVGHTTTRNDGSYRIALRVAAYTVKVTSGRDVAPDTAVVHALRFQHLDFFIDTGIR